MLILLPPSEGKAVPPARHAARPAARCPPPRSTDARRQVLDALVELCRADPERAAQHLGPRPRPRPTWSPATPASATAPTARADQVYTRRAVRRPRPARPAPPPPGAARPAASRSISSLFGLVRPGDRIPAYRLSGDASLPGLGPVAGVWRAHLGRAVREALGPGLLVDLRSTTYAAFWRPEPDLARRVATVRVLHEVDGRRTVVSHFNKATKGRLVRACWRTARNPGAGARPGRRPARAAGLEGRGRQHPAGPGPRLDVVVTEV